MQNRKSFRLTDLTTDVDQSGMEREAVLHEKAEYHSNCYFHEYLQIFLSLNSSVVGLILLYFCFSILCTPTKECYLAAPAIADKKIATRNDKISKLQGEVGIVRQKQSVISQCDFLEIPSLRFSFDSHRFSSN